MINFLHNISHFINLKVLISNLFLIFRYLKLGNDEEKQTVEKTFRQLLLAETTQKSSKIYNFNFKLINLLYFQ
jgi:hypothetical protein